MILVRTAAIGLIALAACAPTVPESGADRGNGGVGFQSYSSYELRQAQAEAADRAYAEGLQPRISDEARPMTATGLPPAAPVDTAAVTPGADVAGETMAALGVAPATPEPLPLAPATPVAPAAAPAPQPQLAAGTSTPTGMSDEQDFDAVAARETIQSDAQRIAENRANYQQVQPVALPERPAGSDTVVIDFALRTSNPVGQKMYDRRGSLSQSRFARACGRYGSQDAAQEDFLRAGGPERDPKYLDPDGDGFACFWDPAPFRLARQGAVAAPVAREVVPGGG